MDDSRARERGTDDDDKWAFEGSPLVEGSDVYVAMRKSDVRPQVHVACFDAETGRRRWRTMICAAETPGGGQAEEITHNLLTLHDRHRSIATRTWAPWPRVSARDGTAAAGPRSIRGPRTPRPTARTSGTAHFYRDLNPCIYYRGLLLVGAGRLRVDLRARCRHRRVGWESHLPEDAVHLLGVGHGNLLASGDSLWWIDAEAGQSRQHWPATSPSGYGRGVLMGDQVVWPTRDELYVFDQAVLPRRTIERDPIPLVEGRGAAGGNLVVGGQPAADRRARQVVRLRSKAAACAAEAPRRTTSAALVPIKPQVDSPREETARSEFAARDSPR